MKLNYISHLLLLVAHSESAAVLGTTNAANPPFPTLVAISVDVSIIHGLIPAIIASGSYTNASTASMINRNIATPTGSSAKNFTRSSPTASSSDFTSITTTTTLVESSSPTSSPTIGNFTFAPNVTIPLPIELPSQQQSQWSVINIGKYSFIGALVIVAAESLVSKIRQKRRAHLTGTPMDPERAEDNFDIALRTLRFGGAAFNVVEN